MERVKTDNNNMRAEGYLLDTASYHVGAEAKLYTVERNSAPAIDVTEQVQKGNIAIIKHSNLPPPK